MRFLRFFKRIILRYRLILLGLFFLWLLTFGLGIVGGWLLVKGNLDKFPELTSQDRVLIITPHVDDETIGAGGVILRSLSKKAKIKVVYLTNGDDSFSSIVWEKRKLKFKPDEFIKLGEERMEEGKRAMAALGVNEKDLIFLGYPDRGLWSMLTKSYNETSPFVSSGTKVNHNPYQNTYKPGRIYAGENLTFDLGEIIDQFSPTLILVSHPRDAHSDHRASFQFLQRALEESKVRPRVLSYLVHYPFYPAEKKLLEGRFLYPPKKLFTQKGWVSFELSQEEENKKLEAMNKYRSQVSRDALLRALVRKNEIFEEIE